MHLPTSMTKGLYLAGISMLLCSCHSVTPPKLSASSAREVDRGVRQMAAAIARDVAAGGPNAWLRYFADERGFFMANNGNLQFSSFEDAKTFLATFSAGIAHLELTWVDIRVDPLAAGLAVMAAGYRETFTDTGGHVRQFAGYFTGLAVQTDTGWKLRDAHWSSPATAQ
jgi:ketosteroid isomerase-like protein